MKSGKLVSTIGLAIMIASIGLWAFNFGDIDLLPCLYMSGLSCSIANSAAVLNGSLEYNPLMFITGVIVFVVGIVLRVLKK